MEGLAAWLACLSKVGLGLVVAAASGAYLWKELTMGRCTSSKQLTGKVAIVTGSSSGVGLETARQLARRGARVILACRNKHKAEAAIRILQKEWEDDRLEFMYLDLGKLQTVRNFAEAVKLKYHKVDILVNNAGMPVEGGHQLTADGLDILIQTNYLAHFLLTNLLKEELCQPDCRIINVSSMANTEIQELNLHTLLPGSIYNRAEAYQASKLMNALFSSEIARRWADSGVTAYSVHPGFVRSGMLKRAAISSTTRWLFTIFGYILGRSEAQGAATSLHCCLEDNLLNGEFYADCRLASPRFKNRLVNDPDLGRSLWQISARITGLLDMDTNSNTMAQQRK